VYVGEELRHTFLGHTVLHDLKQLIFPMTWGGPGNGVPGGYDYPAMAMQLEKARQQGALASWAHFPFPQGELAVNVALGKIDAVELVMWTDPFDEQRPLPVSQIYYRFLNTGAKLAALGGTDKMMNTQVVGSVRTYVKMNGEFNYQGWLEGIRAGRTFATTGPMLSLTASGHGLGETIKATPGEIIKVTAELNSLEPVERIEIIQGGKIVAVKENKAGITEGTLEVEVSVDDSSWIVARANSSKVLPYQTWDYLGAYGIPVLAHTSPIYIEVDGKGATSSKDAAFFITWCDRAIEWATNTAKVHSEQQRREMIELYETAKEFYQQQL